MSIAGGAWRAFARAEAVKANCLQVFVKSNVQWRVPRPTELDVERFNSERARTGVGPVTAHACYLVNPAARDRTIRRKSLADLAAELSLCERYGIDWLVLHPGNHMGAGPRQGIENVASAVSQCLSRCERPGILIETTAGAGTSVGSRFEEIADIIERAGGGPRIGVCVDTSHIFAAGYELRTPEGYAETKSRLASLGLLSRIHAIHANDSKAAFASRVDRHTHIGKGHIGRVGFRLLMTDRDFSNVPKILETPKGMCGGTECDVMNVRLLRRLAR